MPALPSQPSPRHLPLPIEETRLYDDKFIFFRDKGGSIVGRKWKWGLLATAAAVLVAYLLGVQIRSHGFDWGVFWSTVAALRWGWLALALLLSLGTYYGRALRWAVLLKPVKPRPGMWNLFSATAIGFTAITLLGRPGEFVRPYVIALKEHVPFSSQLAALLLERIYDLLMALLVFGFALSLVRGSGVTVGRGLSWVLAVGGELVAVLALACLLLLLLIRHFSDRMRRRLLHALGFLPAERYLRAERLVNAFVQGVESTRSHSALALLTGYTVLEWVLIAAINYCVVNAFGHALHFRWMDILIFMGFVSFGAVVQIPGIGGGVQVVSVLVLTQLFGIGAEVATSVALLIWIITFVVIVPFGLCLALHEGLKWEQLKHVGEGVTP